MKVVYKKEEIELQLAKEQLYMYSSHFWFNCHSGSDRIRERPAPRLVFASTKSG